MKKYELRNTKYEICKREGGQALVTLLIFMSIAMVTTVAAVLVTLINTQTTEKFAQGEIALSVAEAGVENGLLKLLRNGAYTGEALSVGDGVATITVSGNQTKILISEGVMGNFRRKVQVNVSITNNVHTITSWSEVD